MLAPRVLQGVARKGQHLSAVLPQIKQQKSLSRKFALPFTFEEAPPANTYLRITTHANTTNASRQVSSQTTTAAATDFSSGSKSAYATVAPGRQSVFSPSSKFRVPFDEGPSMTGTLDNIVEQVDSIPEDVEKERGYQIIGKVKAGKDDIMKILAVGDMRIWQ